MEESCYDVFLLQGWLPNRQYGLYFLYIIKRFRKVTFWISTVHSGFIVCIVWFEKHTLRLIFFNLYRFAVGSDMSEASGRNWAPRMSEWASHHGLWPIPWGDSSVIKEPTATERKRRTGWRIMFFCHWPLGSTGTALRAKCKYFLWNVFWRLNWLAFFKLHK